MGFGFGYKIFWVLGMVLGLGIQIFGFGYKIFWVLGIGFGYIYQTQKFLGVNFWGKHTLKLLK